MALFGAGVGFCSRKEQPWGLCLLVSPHFADPLFSGQLLQHLKRIISDLCKLYNLPQHPDVEMLDQPLPAEQVSASGKGSQSSENKFPGVCSRGYQGRSRVRGWIPVLGDASLPCQALVLFSQLLFAFNLVLLVSPCVTSPLEVSGKAGEHFPRVLTTQSPSLIPLSPQSTQEEVSSEEEDEEMPEVHPSVCEEITPQSC